MMSNNGATNPDVYLSIFNTVAGVRTISLLSPDGVVLATGSTLCELLGVDAAAVQGQRFETFIAPADQARFAELLHCARQTATAELLATTLHCPKRDQPTVAVEIECIALPDDPQQRVVAVVHRHSLTQRREHMLLKLSHLAAYLLTAQSLEEVIEQAAHVLKPLDLGLAVALFNAEQTTLHFQFAPVSSLPLKLITQTARTDLAHLTVPLPIAGISDALVQAKAIAWPDVRSTLHTTLPEPAARLCQMAMAMQGLRGFIFAPLSDGSRDRGILIVWSPVLNKEDVLIIEALAHQISAVLAQIELRTQLEFQVQRLNSLATTARAVTTLHSLEEVLRTVCVQAQALLSAEFATITLPVPGEPLMECVMATGLGAEQVRGLRMRADAHLMGEVLRTKRGVLVADIHTDARSREQSRNSTLVRSLIGLPLLHQGEVRGTLSIGHSKPNTFTQADLEYAARYAEYAAVAVANAQLHDALQRAKTEQQHIAAENAQLYRTAESVRNYLNTLFHASTDGLFTIRRDTTIHPLNPERLSALTGYAGEHVEDQPFLQFVPEHLQEEMLRHLSMALQGAPRNIETELLKADGTTLHVLLSIVLIPEYDEVFVILKDVTELRKTEMQLHQAEKLAALGRLIAGAAHELNNPLAVILGMAELLGTEDLPTSARADVGSIADAARRMRGIVQQMLTFARPQRSEAQQVDIAVVLRAALERLKAEVHAHAIDVEMLAPRHLPAIMGDQGQLEQVFFNIAHNAVQMLMTNPPECPRRLTMRAWQEPQHVCVAIQDTGTGIQPDQLVTIFEPFYTTRPVGTGTGLGLAMAYAIIDLHGGHIWATSAPDRETTFFVELPIASPRPALINAPSHVNGSETTA